MLTAIASDNATAGRIREIALPFVRECPLSHVVSVGNILDFIKGAEREPELIIVVMSPNVERTLGVLERLRMVTRGTIVAIGPATDAKAILRAVHAGADDYLDEHGELEADLEALLKRLKCASRSSEEPGKIITVAAASGGSGCSLIAANLATALAEHCGRAALCDLDLWKGNLSLLLNLKPRYTLADLCRHPDRLDPELFESALLKHETGVHLLAAPHTVADIGQVNPDGVNQVVQTARLNFPFVVVDLEDFFHREQLRVLQLSDIVLLVLRLDFSALRNTRRAVECLIQAGIERERIRLVANQYGRSKELTREQAEEALGTEIDHQVPDDPKTVLHSINCGAPAVVEAPKSRFARAVIQIAERLEAEKSEGRRQ